jgi:hypothetical protein
MLSRRTFLTRGSMGVLGAAGVALGFPGDGERPGGPPDGSASRGMITEATKKAIKGGLDYLADNCRSRDGRSSFGTGNYSGNVAVTSLAGLAFMAAGNMPDRGPRGRLVTETLRYILDQSRRGGREAGFIDNGGTPHGPMYGHGFATLFLGEAVGMVPSKELAREVKDKLQAAMRLIVRSQNTQGGWRYRPFSIEADLSVTVCQIVALRSGRNAGFAVPKGCVDRCIAYVKRCQSPDGSFMYTLHGGGPRDPFARTGAGLSALYSAGVYSGKAIERGLSFLLNKCKPTGGPAFRPDMQYFYGHYYAAQAMWTAGGHWWAGWFPAIREELLQRQNQDGSWSDQIDPHYATAMACIILQIPNNYLPILQK